MRYQDATLHRLLRTTFVILFFFAAFKSDAAWFDANWTFRREITANWEADKATGGELALAEVYTAGHHKADGSDVRVAGEDGRLMPSRLLGVGPGDQVRVVFALAKGQRKYAVYFGNPAPPAKTKGTTELTISAGLLLDMRAYPGGRVTNAETMLAAWGKANSPIGQTMVPGLMLGKSPLGDVTQWIAKLTGTLNVTAEGEYTFAGAANHSGLLVIDEKPLLYIPQLVGDTRFNAKLSLSKGKHSIEFYHANPGGEGVLSVVWKRPGADKFEPIPKEALGSLYVAVPGPLEEIRKTLTADFKVEYLGECFFANHFAHRYRFTANLPKTQPPKYEWDLGDGQMADGNSVEHVYLAEGVYPIKLTARIASNVDSQTTQFAVRRDVALETPKTDDVAVQSKAVDGYKLDRLPAAHLPWVVLLHERAGRLDAMLAAVGRLAKVTSGVDGALALQAMNEATRAALEAGRVEEALKAWDEIPKDSPMQPLAAREYAKLLVWRAGDFEKAAKLLEPLITVEKKLGKGGDLTTQLLYAQSLILNQKAAEGRKLLEAMPIEGPAGKQAAISGAMARTIEYYAREGEPEAGEEQWDRWQRQYPADFLEGYSVLLRVRLIEARKQPEVAAKVAEAFARAVPGSSYAPTLLDKASRLLEKSNPGRSAQIRKRLKEKYPEDPLSQGK